MAPIHRTLILGTGVIQGDRGGTETKVVEGGEEVRAGAEGAAVAEGLDLKTKVAVRGRGIWVEGNGSKSWYS